MVDNLLIYQDVGTYYLVHQVLHIAWQKPKPFACLYGWSAQDDLVDMSTDEHVHTNCNCEISLARSRRANSECELIFEQRADIGFLSVGARLYEFLAGFDLDRAAFEHLDLRIRSGLFRGHAEFAINVTRRHATPLFKPLVKRHQHLARLCLSLGFTMYRQLIAAPQDLHAKPGFDFGQVAVIFTAQVNQQTVIRE